MQIILTKDKSVVYDLYVKADLSGKTDKATVEITESKSAHTVNLKVTLNSWMNSELGEEALRQVLQDVIAYACQNKLKNIVLDTDSFIGNPAYISYFITILVEELEDLSKKVQIDDTTVAALFAEYSVNKELINELDEELSRTIIETVNQAYGDCGDPLKEEFEQFKNTLSEEKPFRQYLVDLMEQKGIRKSSEVYKAAGVSKFTFSKIINFSINPPYKPSKGTVAALAIGLKLNLEEAEKFYEAAGLHLGKTEPTDLVIRFFIQKGIYRIYDVNYCLIDNKQPPLGEKQRGEKTEIIIK